MPEIVNTFTGGMDTDTQPNAMDAQRYRKAVNMRLVTNEEGKSATLTNIKGWDTVLQVQDGEGSGEDAKIHASFSYTSSFTGITYGVFFCEGVGIAGGAPQFQKFRSTVNLSTVAPVVDIGDPNETAVIGTSPASFNSDAPIEAVFKEEAENLIWMYWCNKGGVIRKDRILTSLTMFSLVTNFSFARMWIGGIVSGALRSGNYQYSYCYYDKDRGETAYYPMTDAYPITPTISSQTDETLFGGSSGETTSSGLELLFSAHSTTYADMRIIRCYNATQEGGAEIEIVYEGPKLEKFIDTGHITLGTKVLEELMYYPNELKASTLIAKNNYLIAGNVQYESMNTDWLDDWDSRVYRFDASSVSRQVKDYSGSFASGTNVWNWTYAGSFPPMSQSEYKTHKIMPSTVPSLGTEVETFRFQTDGTTIGAEGPNIKIAFTGTAHTIDDFSNNFKVNSDTYAITNFVNIGYQRDEVYRFGIVFFDSKGRRTPTKWIGDIKMPNPQQNELRVAPVSATPDTYGKIRTLGVLFSVTITKGSSAGQIPSDIRGFQIVRAVRTDADATVLDAGYLTEFVNDGGVRFSPVPGSGRPALGSNKSNYEYFSGDLKYRNTLQKKADRIDILHGPESLSGYVFNSSKVTGSQFVRNLQGRIRVCVSKLFPPADTPTLHYYTRKNLTHQVAINFTGDSGYAYSIGNFRVRNRMGASTEWKEKRGTKGTCLGVTLGSAISPFVSCVNQTAYGTNDSLQSLYALRRNFVIPYGGVSDAALLNTSYVPCVCALYLSGSTEQNEQTTYFPATSSGDVHIQLYGGDTYITACETQRIIWDPKHSKSNYANVVYAVHESKINFNLKSNKTWSYYDSGAADLDDSYCFDWSSDKAHHAMQEKAGIHPLYTGSNSNAEGVDIPLFTQESDLYVYNPVYSPIRAAYRHTAYDPTAEFREYYPERIVRSEKKISGELSDSWTRFLFNNYIDVDIQYGGITKLLNHNNRLLCFQPSGIGVVGVEEKELLGGSSPTSLVVGTGTALARIDYLSTSVGTAFPTSIGSTETGVFFVDGRKKKIYNLEEGILPVSDLKNIRSWMEDACPSASTGGNKITTLYNPLLQEVIFYFEKALIFSTVRNAIGYSLFTQSFVSEYNSSSGMYGYNYLLSGNGLMNVREKTVAVQTATPLSCLLALIVNPSNTKMCRYDSIGLICDSDAVTAFNSQTPPVSLITYNVSKYGIEGDNKVGPFRNRYGVYRHNLLRTNGGKRIISPYLELEFVFSYGYFTRVYDITTSFTPINVK